MKYDSIPLVNLTIDHIGIAVHSIENALLFYKLMGVKKYSFKEVPSEKVKVCFLSLNNIKLELIEPTDNDSAVGRFLKKRGEGLHQICFRVSNLVKTMEVLRSQGIEFVGEQMREGAEGKVSFIHPKCANGVLVELLEV